MKIIEISILCLVLVVATTFAFNFVRSHIKHQKRMRNLDQWSNFNLMLKEWASEIQDVAIQHEFVHYIQSRYISGHDSKDWRNFIDKWSSDREKLHIYKQWGRWIPSLRQEFRQKNLDKLLN